MSRGLDRIRQEIKEEAAASERRAYNSEKRKIRENIKSAIKSGRHSFVAIVPKDGVCREGEFTKIIHTEVCMLDTIKILQELDILSESYKVDHIYPYIRLSI